ncbi:hypothetical protein DH2020_036385 [Rehmannia glutinosa]|uniref:Peptidase A1 domain-containing protein n=1 Tax=Rehmannia glutinosa TaxID=99300 RepID=A0ABR0V720_REHGL
MASYYKPALLSLFLFCFASVYLLSYIEATKNNGGITIDLIHRDSPLSPSYNPSKTRFDRLKTTFERSVSRKSSLKLTSDSVRTTSASLKDFQAPLSANGGEYLMKVSVGTPPFEILGIADTGSDLTWTQCQPCTQCYKQKAPLFDPRKTKTYRTLSCESQPCSAVGSSSCDTNNVCEYQYSYGDSSYTIGDLAVETFTFDSGTTQSVSFPKVVFGCGHQNEGTFSETGSALVKDVKGKRVSDSQGSFKLCYELTSDFSAPPVIAHFKGADVELTQESTFLEVEQGVVCLTLVPSEDLAIFGNLHQMNYEIGYDIVGQSVNFLRKDCSKAQ